MKLVVLGATGPTGQHVVNEALDQGHDVTAIVRNPDKITTTHEQLNVVKADLTDSSQLVEHFRGCDAILSAIGGRGGIFTPCDVYTISGKAIISAMRESGVKRFICVTAWGTKDDPNLPFAWRWILKPSFLRNVLKNMEDFEDYLSNDCSDINYTVVRPPRLMNIKCSSKPLHTGVGQVVEGYEVATISRQDVAKFMLSCLATEEFDKKMVAVTSRKEDQ